MEEQNLNLNEGQENVVDSQVEQVNDNVETVNADNASVTTDKHDVTKPVQTAEDNAKFAEVRRKAESEARAKARDELIAEMYGKTHGINTYAEYQEALAKQEQEQRLSELLEQNIPEEYAKEMIENRRFREQYESELKSKQQQEKQNADYKDFLSVFPDVKAEDIPTEVWQANANGIPLRYAYAEHALKLSRESELKAKANAANANVSMGSVTGDGVANDSDFISFETYEKNKSDQSWINKNFNKILKSRPNW